jgi:cell division protein FtsL
MREIYYIKPVDNSRLVPVTDPRSPRQYLAILFIGFLVFTIAMTAAWQRFVSVQDGYRLEALQSEKQQILEANRKLRLEEASLVDPVRLDAIARNELGMTTLSASQIIMAEPAGAQEPGVLADARRAPATMSSQVKSVAAAVP